MIDFYSHIKNKSKYFKEHFGGDWKYCYPGTWVSDNSLLKNGLIIRYSTCSCDDGHGPGCFGSALYQLSFSDDVSIEIKFDRIEKEYKDFLEKKIKEITPTRKRFIELASNINYQPPLSWYDEPDPF